MTRGWHGAIAAFSLWASSAAGMDVTGNWSISGASTSQLASVSLTQTGSTLTVCLSGWGTIATGTIDTGTGAFTLYFDPSFTNYLYEFGVCSLDWSGTFALDGNSVAGAEEYSLGCYSPNTQCCLPSASDAITGNRVSPTVVCCGNGIVEGAEVCDISPATSLDCCANDCTLEPPGHFCGATDQCHLKECNAAGICEPLPPSDCGPCYECDPVQGCLADIRSDCAVGGSGSRMRVIRHPTTLKFDWRWREGTSPETTLADFGNPTVGTGYELCVFTRDLIASGFPRVAAALPPGQTCGQTPCWTPKSAGFKYRDAIGSAAGITGAQLTARGHRHSSLKVMGGRGVLLFPPLANQVIVQLSTRDAAPSRCWITTFTSAQLNELDRYIAILP